MEKIICCNNGALCNLIKCIISCMRLSDLKQIPFQIIWMKSQNKVHYNFSELFLNQFDILNKSYREFLNTDFQKNLIYKTSRLYLQHSDVPIGFSKLNRDLTGKLYHDFRHLKGRAIDHEYNRIPLNLQTIYRNYLDKLVIHPYILNSVNDFIINNDLYNFTAVHCRTWNFKNLNHTPRESQRKQTIKLEELIQKILQIPGKVFLCSDNITLIENVKSKNNNIITRNANITGLSPDAKDGFIDLLIASKSNCLYLTLHSTFSEIIWWYNKNNPDVYFI